MKSGVTAPHGFTAAATAAGLYPDRLDMALIVADAVSSAAAVFTTNRVAAAPVVVSRRHAENGRARAILVNAGCANAVTGTHGIDDAVSCCERLSKSLACPIDEILVASTGVIGVRLPMDKVTQGITDLVPALDAQGGPDAARAILTTDTRPKEDVVHFGVGGEERTIGGMAKGSGMIAPNMATMLAFLTTDVTLDPAFLNRLLRSAVASTFNRITVDGDTSTNDMVAILAGGRADAPRIEEGTEEADAFAHALTWICASLAEKIVRDGEGVTRIAEIVVTGAADVAGAARIARTIAESPLVKTALHGGDPNWGRILAAAGRAGVAFDPGVVRIALGEVVVMEQGAPLDYDEAAAAAAMQADPVRIRVDLNGGSGAAGFLTSDFSKRYVEINAHYRS